MKFTVDYPIVVADYDPALVTPEGITKVARSAEEHGFDALAFSEHPAPTSKWLNAGGHESLDQTSALAFCAAVTNRIGLMTYLTVLPYHNPFVAAKALSTVDLLSGGRLSVVAGTGYLKSEFRALNVDMTQRNELFDEALAVMRKTWTGEPVDHDGAHFSARGVISLPRPVQPGGPPVLIGGNSRQARERAVLNQGWSPLLLGPEAAQNSRTAGFASLEELAGVIRRLRGEAAEAQGTGVKFLIQLHTPHTGGYAAGGISVEEHRDHLGQLADAGIDSFVLRPPGESQQGTADFLAGYAQSFLT